jgi:hypothetical protein
MKIEVIHKVVFGQNRFYPSSKDAYSLCSLMNTKSFTEEHLKKCKKAGWEVIIVTMQFDLG